MPRESYKDTRVDVGRTQQQIRTLLLRHSATGIQFLEDFNANTLGFAFSYVKELQDGPEKRKAPVAVKMLIHVWRDPKKRLWASQSARDARDRQVWRALYWYLKSQFDAVDFGLRSLEETFLGDIVLADGRVIGEHIREALSTGTLRLPAPKETVRG